MPTATRGELTVLATAEYPVALATYGGIVYFADFADRSIRAVDQSGAELFRANGKQLGNGIVANASGVYWAAESSLNRAELDGSNITSLSSDFAPAALALGPNGLYGSGATGSRTLVSVGLSGGSTVSLTTDSVLSYGVAVDADHVYWSTYGENPSIRSAPIAKDDSSEPGESKLLATSSGRGGSIAIDVHNVYWVADGLVMKVPLGGGGATALASGTPCQFISGIAVDGESVYWSTANAIMKVSVDGGVAEELVSGLDSPAAVAVDDTSVYWANLGTSTRNGTIMKLTPK